VGEETHSVRWSGGLGEVPVETGSPGQHCVAWDKDASIEIGLKAGKGLIGRPGGFSDRATIHPAAWDRVTWEMSG
jgi:hypothetical protein